MEYEPGITTHEEMILDLAARVEALEEKLEKLNTEIDLSYGGGFETTAHPRRCPMPRRSPTDAKATDLIQLIGAPTRTDSLSRGCGRTLIAGPSRPALLELLGELGAWEHRLASEAATTADPVAAAETRGAVHALALVVEAAAEAARSSSVPTHEVVPVFKSGSCGCSPTRFTVDRIGLICWNCDTEIKGDTREYMSKLPITGTGPTQGFNIL